MNMLYYNDAVPIRGESEVSFITGNLEYFDVTQWAFASNMFINYFESKEFCR